MFRATWLVLFILIVMCCGCMSDRVQPQEVWISSILAQPDQYWNATVKIIGIVQDINVYPKGSRQGFYMLMDRNREVIQIASLHLPNVADRVVVVGIVGQNPDNARLPLIVETDRQWVWTSFIYIAASILLMVGSSAFIIFRFFRPPTSAVAAPTTIESRHDGLQVKAVVAGVKPPQRKPQPVKASPFQQSHSETVMIESVPLDPPKKGLAGLTLELEAIAGPDKGKRYHFTRSVITIGRSGKRLNDIELNDITISREQARIELNRSGNGFLLKNEGVTNPTLVNGKALAIAHLKNGDELLVGTTLLKYRVIE